MNQRQPSPAQAGDTSSGLQPGDAVLQSRRVAVEGARRRDGRSFSTSTVYWHRSAAGIAEHAVEGYVIIDDHVDMGELRSHLVQTQPAIDCNQPTHRE